jgi:L-lactate dehydrogenase complex protein LldG
MATDARTEMLAKIRGAIGEGSATGEVRTEWTAIPRDYKRVATLDHEEILDKLEDRLLDYDAQVVRVKPGGVSAAIAARLAERGKHKLVVPVGLEEALGETLPPPFEFVTDYGLTAADGLAAEVIDGCEGVVTSSTLAIAETGTIVLQAVPGQGRRVVTLVPDYHLCVVRSTDVVETVPEGMAMLAGTASLATTFFSGPSATADIEMTRVKGVHGPRFLDVILVV